MPAPEQFKDESGSIRGVAGWISRDSAWTHCLRELKKLVDDLRTALQKEQEAAEAIQKTEQAQKEQAEEAEKAACPPKPSGNLPPEAVPFRKATNIRAVAS